jgi:hypothetical protein
MPSRNSVRRREESHTSVADRIIKLVDPVGGETGAVTVMEIIYGIIGYLSVRFDGPMAKDFLQTIISSECRSAFSTTS